MVQVHPFKGIRPAKELADKVAALPYDVVNSQEAKDFAADNPYSYFHIDKAEIDLPADLSPYDEQVYQKAADNLAMFLEKGWLFKEDAAYFYLYELVMDGRSQTGIVACTAISDYIDEKIKKHEFTRHEKEIDRMNHIRICDANTSPIFLSYRPQAAIQTIIKDWQTTHAPVYDFTSYHEVTHRVWVIDQAEAIEKLTTLFTEVDALYIADGHHRTESAVKIGLEKRESGEQNPETEQFLSIIFPEDELAIWEYNRVLKTAPPADFTDRLKENYQVTKTGIKKPEKAGDCQLYDGTAWYTLTIKPDKVPNDPVEKLDVALLQKYVLEDIFGIDDIRTDKRIDFVGGIRGTEELEKLVDSDEWKLAFSMYPTQMTDLLDVADAKKIMPPKSTWFEPKLLSGLFLHDLETK
ncbi:DUF1015 domain-containing protein [Enterococcus hulanensis]|uniref:DUF1015 domain-containing protein n=1 Tax=Enterococcus TaxID=1350 RepID=UPI000B5A8F03|nr:MULTISPECIES: DUF1015 family protein [Enterococcus]MBO0413708.1 DUF1015 domain-containing protein [Enterococcus hulanensis]OTO14734.1 hypothetical protein A5875_003891 [Enterococcus sp. 3H8_DIV0648]